MTANLPKALLFDVFGACVDWRSGVAREGEALGRRLGITGVHWFAVADAWREQYQPRMETVRGGGRPRVTLDVPHRESLDAVLATFGLDEAPAPEGGAFPASMGCATRNDCSPCTVANPEHRSPQDASERGVAFTPFGEFGSTTAANVPRGIPYRVRGYGPVDRPMVLA